MIFHQRSIASLARLGPELRIFMPAVLTIIETGIINSKKFKNDRNNVKPSRGVILCHIVTIKNFKLGLLQIFPKKFSKWAIMFDVSWLSGQTTNVMARIAT